MNEHFLLFSVALLSGFSVNILTYISGSYIYDFLLKLLATNKYFLFFSLALFSRFSANFSITIDSDFRHSLFPDTTWSSRYWRTFYQLDRWRSPTPGSVWSYGVHRASVKIPRGNWREYEVNGGYVAFSLMSSHTLTQAMIRH